jgi:polyisoprenoid-binding protein YceI
MKTAALLALIILGTGAFAADAPLDVAASSLKFTGHAFLHDFHGGAKEFRGTARIDPAIPQLVTGATIEITAAKLTTFIDARDHNMIAWLKVEANPTIHFELTKVKSLVGDLAHATKDHPARFAVSGTFTLNNVAKPLETEASAWREGKQLVVEGTTKIDTSDHGLPEVRTLFLTVDRQVDIAFHLVFDGL